MLTVGAVLWDIYNLFFICIEVSSLKTVNGFQAHFEAMRGNGGESRQHLN
jgi:hypothetical protein